ncbi:MAG: pilus assembly protein TadG-related protein [Bryobacterales bacterium]
MRSKITQRCRGEEGIGMVLGVTTLGVIALALCAMCVDMARVYIAKNELQTYADAATLAANAELTGPTKGSIGLVRLA